MTITIHHGAPGSYKTSGVVQDYFIPAVRAGRIVATNIRGLSVERTIEILGEEFVPDSFDIHYIDTSVQLGRDKIGKWFHWLPEGAILLVDECSVCFPKKWRQSDLAELEYESVDKAKADNRPFDWQSAFDMHRHYNWDIVIMNPSIKTVRDDIRSAAEAAYKHANMAQIGIRGRYKEGYHNADNNGLPSNIQGSKLKKIKKKTFKLYDSTTTGQVKDTTAGSSVFANMRVLLGILFLAAAFWYSYSTGGWDYFIQNSQADPQSTSAEGDLQDFEESRILTANVSAETEQLYSDDLLVLESNPIRVADNQHYFLGYKFRIIGYTRIGGNRSYIFDIFKQGYQSLQQTSGDLKGIGYTIYPINRCSLRLQYEKYDEIIHCAPRIEIPLETRQSLSRTRNRG